MKVSVKVPGVDSFGGVAFALFALAAIAPATAIAQNAEVTFTKDVAPILQNSCQTCHREGAIAPMSLMTFEDTRPWARAIKDRFGPTTIPIPPTDNASRKCWTTVMRKACWSNREKGTHL